MPDDQQSSPRSQRPGAADRVGSILAAAEEAAERIRAETEVRVRERIAEGRRAADNRVEAAEQEAAEILAAARTEADQIRRAAHEAATRSQADLEHSSRELLSDARITAQEVRREGMELVANLRQMGDSLRTNAERILRDVQGIHSQMITRIERAESGGRTAAATRRKPRTAAGRDGARSAFGAEGDGEVPEVPEFIPRR